MIVRYAHFILKWRWLILLGCSLAVALAFMGLPKLSFSSNYRIFFSESNPQLRAFEELQSKYSKNDNILFVLAPKDGKVFTRKTLAAVEWLTNKAEITIPHHTRVDSITNYQHSSAKGDDITVARLVEDAEKFSDRELQRVKKIALSEPLLVNRIISSGAHVTGVNVIISLPGKSTREVPNVAKSAREIAQQLREKYPHLKVYLTGLSMMNNAFSEAAKRDVTTLVPLMYFIVIVILGVMLRSFWSTITTLLVIAMSIIIAMGAAGWMGIKLSAPTTTAPTIILTLAIADSVHFLITMFNEMRHGKNKHDAIVESLRLNFQPIFLTSITTAIGFLSMNFSDAPPFRDLGNITAMGVMAAFIFSVSFLPAAISLLPLGKRKKDAMGSQSMIRFADFVVKRRKPLLWIMLPLIIILISFIPRNELNDEFVKYFDKSVPFRVDTDFTSANLTGIYQIGYDLRSGKSRGINDPEYLKHIEHFTRWLRQQQQVTHVTSLTDIVKRINKNMHGDDPKWYRIPEQQDLAAQYLFLYENQLPRGLELTNQIDIDKSSTRLTVTLKNISTKELLHFESRVQQWFIDNVPKHMATPGASPSIMFAFIGERNIKSMLLGSTLALVLISFIIIVAVRSLKIGLISLLPNLLPAAMAFGVWGLLVGRVGLALSVVIGLTLGIVVDDTIHFLSKYLRAKRERNLSAEDAVRYAFRTVGTALWVNSLILAAGFFVLIFSAFEINSGMGKMATITIVFALLADFLFLPPLLMLLEKKRNA